MKEKLYSTLVDGKESILYNNNGVLEIEWDSNLISCADFIVSEDKSILDMLIQFKVSCYKTDSKKDIDWEEAKKVFEEGGFKYWILF